MAIVTAEESRLVAVNDAFVQLTGISRNRAVDAALPDLGLFEDPVDYSRLSTLLAERSGIVREADCRLRLSDGTTVRGAISIQQFESCGVGLRVVVVGEISARKQWADAFAAGVREASAARKEERSRIARDLHDDISQRLALLQMGIDHLKDSAFVLNEKGVEHVDDLSRQAGEIISAMRSVVYKLHPPDLPNRPLDDLLSDRCAALGEALKLTINFRCRSVPNVVPGEVAECLVRVLQEAVSNAAKYSGSDRILVSLWEAGRSVNLSIRDFGVGFDTDAATTGIGLSTMRERVGALGGIFWILSRPRLSRGTSIGVYLPLPRSAPAV